MTVRSPTEAIALPEDARLLDGIRASEPRALEESMRLYWGPLMHYARAIAPDSDTAEDAVQEAFIRLWSRRRRWTMSGNLRGLLFRVVRNLLLNQRRSSQARQRWLQHLARRPLPVPPSPAEESEVRDLAAAVDRAIQALPTRRREVFVLVRKSGLSYQEAADILGLSRQTVANQMSAALSTLRQALEPYLEMEQGDPIPFPRERRTS